MSRKRTHNMSSHRRRLAKAALLERQGGHCAECLTVGPLTMHHIIPPREGGSRGSLDNLVLLCEPCHAAKHGTLNWVGWQDQ